MSKIKQFNSLAENSLRGLLLRCCGSEGWVNQMLGRRPLEGEVALDQAAAEVWQSLLEKDWREAFLAHPPIGGRTSEAWSSQEQSSVKTASLAEKNELEKLNRFYVDKFGFRFIIFAQGLSPLDFLTALRARLLNDPRAEIGIARDEVCKITRLRLKKLLEEL